METPHGHGKKGIKRFLYTTALVAVLLSGKSYKEGGWEQLGEDRKRRYEMTIGKGVSWVTSLFQHEPGKFFDKKISPDGQYSIYTYILKYGGTPGAVKKQANDQGIGKAVKIINEKGEDITDSKEQLKAGDIITVYIENSDALHEPGTFFDKKISPDGQYSIYTYILKYGGTPGAVKNQAKIQRIGDAAKITNEKGEDITNLKKQLKAGESVNVYIKNPNAENDEGENNEIENETIENMKCKGGEYFGIDISHHNQEIKLDKFIKRNRDKWDSEKQDTRGVSFIYMRASDGYQEDNKVGNHVNKIQQYNNDPTIQANKEKIAVGFYHRLNSYSGEKQAETFLKTYNKYKNTTGGNDLKPMLDIEGKRLERNTTTIDSVRKKAKIWLNTVEKETGIIPGIYITVAIYNKYFKGDTTFNRYGKRIAAYPDSDNNTHREKGKARRIDFEKGAVNHGTKKKPQNIKPDMYQSSEEGTVGGAYAVVNDGRGKHKKTYFDVDMDHAKDMTKLISKYNKSNNNK